MNINSWVRYLATVRTLLTPKYTISNKKPGSKKKQENKTKDNPCDQSNTPQAAVITDTQRAPRSTENQGAVLRSPCRNTFVATGLIAGGQSDLPQFKIMFKEPRDSLVTANARLSTPVVSAVSNKETRWEARDSTVFSSLIPTRSG